MRFWGLFLALGALLSGGLPAVAQTSGQGAAPASACLAPDTVPAAAIAACTAVLAAEPDASRRALAFYRRAEASIKTGNLGRAIADLTAAIAANPDYGDAYYDRASPT